MVHGDVFPGDVSLRIEPCWFCACFSAWFGNIHKPGSGLGPFGTTTLLELKSLGLTVKGLLRRKQAPENRSCQEVKWGTLILVVGGLIGHAVLFESLGFFSPCFSW
jgi:hypothetical protein